MSSKKLEESEATQRSDPYPSKELSIIKWTVCFSFWIWLLISSRTFQSILPLKYLPSDLGVYGENATELISLIGGISINETSIKVLEPSILVTNADMLLSFTLYEYDDEFENMNFDISGKTLTLSYKLEKPGANYFGLNSDFMYDLQEIFDDTIYDLYFDEYATDFKDSMDLDKLSRWLQVLGILRLVLLIFLVGLLGSLALSFLKKINRKFFKRMNQYVLGPCLTMTHLGFVICMSFIIHTFPSGFNGLNLFIMIMGLILSTAVETKGLL